MMQNFTSNNNPNFFWWFGVVEDRNDPLRLGRCRIRILGYHTDDKEVLPSEDLPWAIPVMPANSAGTSGVGWSPTGAVEGSWCVGFFADGEDGQHPMFFGTVGAIPGGLVGTGCGDGSGSGQPGDSATSDGSEVSPDAVKNLTPAEATKVALDAVKFFMSKGWTKAQAAGIVGNLQTESGNFNPNVISGRKKGDSGRAVGVAQWHPDRQANFQKKFGKSIIGSSLNEQLEFIHFELTSGTERGAGNKLRAIKDNTENGAMSAASTVDKFYERSSGAHRNQRMANAKKLFNTAN